MTHLGPIFTGEAMLKIAIDQALDARRGGDKPIGAAVIQQHRVVAVGRSLERTTGDRTAHAEVAALRASPSECDLRDGVTLATTLTPCWMCAGTVLHLGVKEIVVGNVSHYTTSPLRWLASHGVVVHELELRQSVDLMAEWVAHNPGAWRFPGARCPQGFPSADS